MKTNAKLGETREQLISRYGELVKEENKEKELGGHVLFFLFKEYEVEVIIVSQIVGGNKFTNTAEAISFQKKDGTCIGGAEKSTLMGEYGEKGDWVSQRLGKPAALSGRDKEEFYLKKDQKNEGIMCILNTVSPYGITFISEKYYGAIIESSFGGMSPPVWGK